MLSKSLSHYMCMRITPLQSLPGWMNGWMDGSIDLQMYCCELYSSQCLCGTNKTSSSCCCCRCWCYYYCCGLCCCCCARVAWSVLSFVIFITLLTTQLFHDWLCIKNVFRLLKMLTVLLAASYLSLWFYCYGQKRDDVLCVCAYREGTEW